MKKFMIGLLTGVLGTVAIANIDIDKEQENNISSKKEVVELADNKKDIETTNMKKENTNNIRADYEYVNIDPVTAISKIDLVYDKKTDISTSISRSDLSLEDKSNTENIEKFIKTLPINELGEITEIKFENNQDGSNIIRVKINLYNQMEHDDFVMEAEYNTLLMQTFVKNSHCVEFTSEDSGGYMGAYDYFREVLLSDL